MHRSVSCEADWRYGLRTVGRPIREIYWPGSVIATHFIHVRRITLPGAPLPRTGASPTVVRTVVVASDLHAAALAQDKLSAHELLPILVN